MAATCVILKPVQSGFKALILQWDEHKKDERAGLWTIPGGKLEFKDWGPPIPGNNSRGKVWNGALRRALIREIREETRLDLCAYQNDLKLLPGNEECIVVDQKGETMIVMRYFLVLERNWRGDISISQEFVNHDWITRHEIPDHSFFGSIDMDIGLAMDTVEQTLSGRASKIL